MSELVCFEFWRLEGKVWVAKIMRRLPRVLKRWAISTSVNQTIESTVVTEDLRVSTVITRIRVTLTTEIVFALFPVPLLRLNADTTTKSVMTTKPLIVPIKAGICLQNVTHLQLSNPFVFLLQDVKAGVLRALLVGVQSACGENYAAAALNAWAVSVAVSCQIKNLSVSSLGNRLQQCGRSGFLITGSCMHIYVSCNATHKNSEPALSLPACRERYDHETNHYKNNHGFVHESAGLI